MPSANSVTAIGAAVSFPNPGEVELINPAQFENLVLKGKGRVVVEFMSFGCGYCQAAQAGLHRAAHELADDMKIYQITKQHQAGADLAAKYGPAPLPHFVMFEDGEYVGTVSRPGASMDAIKDAICGVYGI